MVKHDNEDIDIDPNISKVDIVERGILSQTTTLSRTDLTGRTVSGPVLVRDENSTVYVPFGWQVRLDDFYNIVLKRGSE